MPHFKTRIFSLLSAIIFLLAIWPVAMTANKVVGQTTAGISGGRTAAEPIIVNVWPEGKMPGQGAAEAEADRPPNEDNVRRITNISRPTLTIFPAAKKDAPAVIICPGGGYNYVVYDKEGTEVAAWLNSNGMTALVLKYRTPKNREGAFQDTQRALSLARAHAAEWNINPRQLGIMGFSAGGNLAAKASNLFDQRSYPAIDEVDRQSSRPDFALLIYPAYLDKDGQIAAELNLKAQIPPTLIVSTQDDKISVTGSQLYHAALDAAKIPNQFNLYADGGHGYALRSDKAAHAWAQAAMEWLRAIGVLPVVAAGTAISSPPLIITPPAKNRFQIYLLMGQSNMVGRDTRSLDSQVENPRVLALDGAGQWVMAREPMHTGGTGIGPGISFALEMLKADPKITIGLVPCAVGGTSLRRWVKGADLYEKCLSRVRAIAAAGTIKGVLWHQGESDTDKKENAETYGARLSQMLKDLRLDLGITELPIVVGQLGEFLTSEKYPYVGEVRAAIKNIPVVVLKAGYADSSGLGNKGDNLHFSAEAEKELGLRYARAMQELQK